MDIVRPGPQPSLYRYPCPALPLAPLILPIWMALYGRG